MPGIVVEEDSNPPAEDIVAAAKSPKAQLSQVSPVDMSIERLYDNVCEMESSCEGSLSRQSFGSEVEESRIDSELCQLVGVKACAGDILEEKEIPEKTKSPSVRKTVNSGRTAPRLSTGSAASSKTLKKIPLSRFDSETSSKSVQGKTVSISPEKRDKVLKKRNPGLNSVKKGISEQSAPSEAPTDGGGENPDLGPFLLKHARDLVAGDNHRRALDYVIRATKSFEKSADGKSGLDLVMCLHVLASIHCSLEQYDEAIQVLEQSIEIPDSGENLDHALAKFSGYMQLGDVYWLLGLIERAIQCYSEALEIQKGALGCDDPRVGETCRYLSEAHLQILQLEEAEKLCQAALDIHKVKGEEPLLEEIADQRLMALICETKGNYETALEHLVMASMAMVSEGHEVEVAPLDCSIGDAYSSLSRYDEAVFAYQKALTALKLTKGENHPAVASVFVRLAALYNRTGKLRESHAFCENALKIYAKPPPGTPAEDIASGLTDISSIYESMNEQDQALRLLKKALKMFDDASGQRRTVAGIEAQIGVLQYTTGNFAESYESFKSSIAKLRACGEKKSLFFGIVLNQMGLTCIHLYSISEAADLFEEAKAILDQEYGPYHPETLAVWSNLAGIYDALGRVDDAIRLLEHVVATREEKLGTANPDVDDEKRRLAELLKEAGRVRSRKARSLNFLLGASTTKRESVPV
ncbi:protein KINESIN LIGHT CHAIN-RELATED 2-like [Wolffia australiana]